jgi:hypothetical protein
VEEMPNNKKRIVRREIIKEPGTGRKVTRVFGFVLLIIGGAFARLGVLAGSGWMFRVDYFHYC